MYSFESRIRYSEVSQENHLSTSSIINYFQDCSTFQSEDLNKGIDYLANMKRAWILNAWQLEVSRFPKLFEKITVGTWAYDFSNIYGYRNFILKDQNDQICAAANSIWILIDTLSNKPVRISKEDAAGYPLDTKLEMNYASRKISIPKDLEPRGNFAVIPANIDSNGHVNNAQYINMAETYLPKGFIIAKLRAQYCMPALLGEIIYPKVHIQNDLCLVVLASESDRPYAVIEFKN